MHAPYNLGVHERLAREASVPLLLVVVVERCAKEDALACAGCSFSNLEPGDLHQYGASFCDDDNANDGEEKPCLHQDEHDADSSAKANGAGIAHIDFCRRAVEPKVSEQCACNGGREWEEFVAAGEVRYAQVLAKDEVAAHVGDKAHKEHAGKNRHRNEAVETVREVRSVCGCRDDERHECDENPVGEVYLEHVNRAERNGQIALQFRDELVAEHGNDKAEQKVEEKSERAGNTICFVHVIGGFELALVYEALGADFGHVVGGSNGAEQSQNHKRRDGVAVHLANEQRYYFNDNHEEEAAHNRRGFSLSVFVEIARGVQPLQKTNVLRHEEKYQDNGEHGGNTRTEQTTVKKVNVSCLI